MAGFLSFSNMRVLFGFNIPLPHFTWIILLPMEISVLNLEISLPSKGVNWLPLDVTDKNPQIIFRITH